MLSINQVTTFHDLAPHLNQDRSISLVDPVPQTYFERLSTPFTGRAPVNEKVYSLIKAKVNDHITEKFRIGYGDEESSAIDDAAEQLLKDCRVNYRDLNTTVAIRQVFEWIDRGLFFSPCRMSTGKILN